MAVCGALGCWATGSMQSIVSQPQWYHSNVVGRELMVVHGGGGSWWWCLRWAVWRCSGTVAEFGGRVWRLGCEWA